MLILSCRSGSDVFPVEFMPVRKNGACKRVLHAAYGKVFIQSISKYCYNPNPFWVIFSGWTADGDLWWKQALHVDSRWESTTFENGLYVRTDGRVTCESFVEPDPVSCWSRLLED